MSDPPMLSSTAKDLLAKVRMMVPPMLEKFHKGQLGRVAVIGGSQDYTGAPYFSAMASARLGADMSYVICESDAAQVIKTYSPNIMVAPLLRQSQKTYPSHPNDSNDPVQIAKPIIEMLPRLHVLVIGPGLGRDELMHGTVAEVIRAAKKTNTAFVLDADALNLVKNHPDLVKDYKHCILTPNVVEFTRLAEAVGVDISPGKSHGTEAALEDRGENCAKVARALGGVVVVQKGGVDVISNGSRTIFCDLEGGRKRSGGQGDTLTGSIGTLLAWRAAYLDKLWDETGEFDEAELLLLAAYGGSAITRECSRLAFKEHGRSLQASHVGENVPRAFQTLIGEKDGSKL